MKNDKHTEYSFEVPNVGQVLLVPFKYDNGRLGFMVNTKEEDFNLTLNMDEVEVGYLILKMYDNADIIAKHILKKTDLFEFVNTVTVGRDFGKVVKFK